MSESKFSSEIGIKYRKRVAVERALKSMDAYLTTVVEGKKNIRDAVMLDKYLKWHLENNISDKPLVIRFFRTTKDPKDRTEDKIEKFVSYLKDEFHKHERSFNDPLIKAAFRGYYGLNGFTNTYGLDEFSFLKDGDTFELRRPSQYEKNKISVSKLTVHCEPHNKDFLAWYFNLEKNWTDEDDLPHNVFTHGIIQKNFGQLMFYGTELHCSLDKIEDYGDQIMMFNLPLITNDSHNRLCGTNMSCTHEKKLPASSLVAIQKKNSEEIITGVKKLTKNDSNMFSITDNGWHSLVASTAKAKKLRY